MELEIKPRFKIVVDVEASGSCPIRNGVISACFLAIDENKNVVSEFRRFVCPPDLTPFTWSHGAESVHHQPFNLVKTYMSNDQFCYEFLCWVKDFLNDDGFPLDLIFHASKTGQKEFEFNDENNNFWRIYPNFDYNFLEWCFRKASYENGSSMVWTFYKVFSSRQLISTVQMGKEAGHKGNSLKKWAQRLGFMLNHHDDRSDTYCCLEVYKYLDRNNDNDSSEFKLQNEV